MNPKLKHKINILTQLKLTNIKKKIIIKFVFFKLNFHSNIVFLGPKKLTFREQ